MGFTGSAEPKGVSLDHHDSPAFRDHVEETAVGTEDGLLPSLEVGLRSVRRYRGVQYRKNEIVGAEISKYARTKKGRGRQTIMIAAKRRVNLILANGRLKKKIPKHKIRGGMPRVRVLDCRGTVPIDEARNMSIGGPSDGSSLVQLESWDRARANTIELTQPRCPTGHKPGEKNAPGTRRPLSKTPKSGF
jgi:hypothetical protein